MAKSGIEKWHIELAAENSIPESALRSRVNQHGWTPEKAATEPIQKPGAGLWRKRPGPARMATPEEIAAMEARGIKYEVWPQEVVDARLEEIGPDKGFEMHANRGKQTSVTAPQMKKDKFRRYYKKGGEW